MHLMYTIDAAGKRVYTLKKVTGGNEVTKSAHPARFSPDDKWSKYVSSHFAFVRACSLIGACGLVLHDKQ